MPNRSLPPLDLLMPFEASARLGSFTRAAEELAVTQSAISQRVRKLEDLLGIPLFRRHHRAIELTPEGRELLNGVSVALRHLSSATHGVRQRKGRPTVRIAVDSSIAQYWLMPRLKRVLAETEKLSVNLTVSDTKEEALEADVAVVHGDGRWPGYAAWHLFSDEIFPICAPSYLQHCPIHAPQDILKADLIDLDYAHWNWINWGIWLTEAGFDPSQARILIRTNSYPAQLEAAREGLGIALGWRHFQDADLQSGALVRPISESVGTRYGYYLLLREGAEDGAETLAAKLRLNVMAMRT